MADVYMYTFLIIGILLSWSALLVAFNLLLPTIIKRTEAQLAASAQRSFLIGLPIVAVFVLLFITAVSAGSGIMQAVGYLFGGLLLLLWLFGGAGMARVMGRRMGTMSTQSELSRMIRGTAVFTLASLCPIVGWFIFLPITGITGIGAAVLSWRKPRMVEEQITVTPAQG